MVVEERADRQLQGPPNPALALKQGKEREGDVLPNLYMHVHPSWQAFSSHLTLTLATWVLSRIAVNI